MKHTAQGFTLIELMIGIAVLAILLGLGVPSFVNVMNSNRVSTSANDLLAALSLTRSEALKRGIPVAICPANTAQTACTNSPDWTTGWIIFEDSGATAGAVDLGENILQVFKPVSSGLTASGTVNFVRYFRDGSRDGVTDPKITMSKTTTSRCVTVLKPGRSNLTKVACT